MANFYCVYRKDVPYITIPQTEFNAEAAEALGFDEYEPKNEGALQYYIEKPNKKQLPFFFTAIAKFGIKANIVKYDVKKSEELGWKLWDGFTFGYKDHPEMREIAERFIKTDEEHKHLAAARIKYCFKKGVPREDKSGQFALAYVAAAPRLAKNLGKWDFLMVTYESTWSMLKENARKRLIDHELHHLGFGIKGKGGPYLIDHDLMEFKSMFKKYKITVGEDLYLGAQEIVKLGIEQQKEQEKEEKDEERKRAKE